MKSNLSKFELSKGNHLVTALTQEAVNNTMKEHLYMTSDTHNTYMLCAFDDNGKSVYFSVTKHTDMSLLPKEFPDELHRSGLYSELDKLNLFAIPSDKEKRTPEQKQAIKNAYDNYWLDSAFQFITGLPSIFSPLDIKAFDPLNLIASNDPAGCGAVYTQCFKEVTVVEIKEVRRSLAASIQRQSKAGAPWTIDYKILYSLERTEYNNLPPDVKEELLNHFNTIPESQIGNLFEITQLILDLTTLSRSSAPEIKGISKSTQLNIIAAFEEFIKTNLEEAMVNGYVVAPSEKNTYDYMFKPTKYTFSVTKSPNGDARYKTLNYIMSTTADNITPQSYDWEWVNPADPDMKSGVMAINRDIFFNKFNQEFKFSTLRQLRKHFIASMKGDHGVIWDMEYCYEVEDDSSVDNGVFTFSPARNQYEYTNYEYHSKSDFISVYVPPVFAATGQLEFNYSFKCSAKWDKLTVNGVSYPALLYSTEITLYTDINYDSGHSTGNIYHHTINCYIGIGVNEYGKVALYKSVSDIDHGSTLDISGWSSFASFGGINIMVKGLTATVNTWISGVVSSFKNTFAQNFLGYANWVMLGNKSFNFSKEEFSDYGDYCTNVEYVNPANEYIMERIQAANTARMGGVENAEN